MCSRAIAPSSNRAIGQLSTAEPSFLQKAVDLIVAGNPIAIIGKPPLHREPRQTLGYALTLIDEVHWPRPDNHRQRRRTKYALVITCVTTGMIDRW